MTACLTGCTLRDRHLADCEGDCWGCLPRNADDGRTLCKRCCSRLAGAVAAAPPLIEHLRSIREPGAGVREDVKRGKGDPPAPLNLAAISDADDLHNALVCWACTIMEECDLRGPDMRGTIWAQRDAGSDRVPAGIRIGNPSAPVAEFLRTHLEWLTSQPFSDEPCRELVGMVETLEHKWPRDIGKQTPDVPCPRCRRVALAVHPPAGKDRPRLIRCEHIMCGAILTEDEYQTALGDTVNALESGEPVEVLIGDSIVEVTRGRAS